ncbi:MAG: DNA repair protein RadA [Acidimicrobiia bacterium]|nr:DNA repair protein RadA [Acidimicrobiia bacterium]
MSIRFHCEHCGYAGSKWMGFCPQCDSTEPLQEIVDTPTASITAPPVPLAAARAGNGRQRLETGINEFDRVLGGGLVSGSVVLLGGEPGVGKSTLTLQAMGSLASSGAGVLLAGSEESPQQVGLRAERLGLGTAEIDLLTSADVDQVVSVVAKNQPDVVVVDSIQTLSVPDIGGVTGGMSQIRECAARLVRVAKTTGTAVILVGHVTKDGGLAGPKALEHIVDVVLSLEGDPDRGLRALRSFKNRFGATHVVGMFDMQHTGLVEVLDPSKAFLAEWDMDVPGTIAFPAVEGARSVMVEIQALVTESPHTPPRRSVRGVEASRIHQILAVLTRHCSIDVSNKEVYVNVVGGWRLVEPGCDLPVALAIASSTLNRPLGSLAAWGEIGLAAEVRAVPLDLRRREEAKRVGIGTSIAAEQGSRLRLIDAMNRSGLTV